MPTSTARPGLAGLVFTDPHHDPAWRHEVIRAQGGPETSDQLTPVRGELDAVVVGAGRTRPLEEWVRGTWTTSLLVLDGPDVLHEWYAGGHDGGTLFLGASMTKSVLAHLVGR